MARISVIDAERRYTKIKRLVKKYHKKDVFLPEVIIRVAAEMNIHTNTVRRALKKDL